MAMQVLLGRVTPAVQVSHLLSQLLQLASRILLCVLDFLDAVVRVLARAGSALLRLGQSVGLDRRLAPAHCAALHRGTVLGRRLRRLASTLLVRSISCCATRCVHWASRASTACASLCARDFSHVSDRISTKPSIWRRRRARRAPQIIHLSRRRVGDGRRLRLGRLLAALRRPQLPLE